MRSGDGAAVISQAVCVCADKCEIHTHTHLSHIVCASVPLDARLCCLGWSWATAVAGHCVTAVVGAAPAAQLCDAHLCA